MQEYQFDITVLVHADCEMEAIDSVYELSSYTDVEVVQVCPHSDNPKDEDEDE